VGKTTIAKLLLKFRPETQLLDGDEMRKDFWPSLGVVHGDRVKNVVRLSTLAAMLMEHGANVIVACVSPDLKAREVIREKLSAVGKFYSVWLWCADQRKKLHPNTLYENGDHDLTLNTGNTGDMGIVEGSGFHVATEIMARCLPQPQRQLFIGRWQPFHAGHQVIVREALVKGPVAIGVRQTSIDLDNPMPVQVRIKQIRDTFDDGEDVVVFAMPDIESIHIGREVGYEVHRDVPGISGTDERRKSRE
jgi:hypothetical protein